MSIFNSIKSAAGTIWRPSEVGFSPGEPLRPQNPTEVIRREDYQIGRNMLVTPRAAEARSVTYGQMRALADINGVLRTVIEKRKDELAGLNWGIGVKKEFESQGEFVAERLALEKFWSKPDGDTTFDQWLKSYMEDVYVIDAPTLHRAKDRLGRLGAVEIVDGSTILVLVDDRGRIPNPPEAAYEQVIKGMPRTWYDKRDLIYRPYNTRSSGVYGFSHVESIIMTVNIALRRDVTFLEWFRSGNIPQALAQAPETWTPEQITQWQETFDLALKGDLQARSGLHWIPHTGEPVQQLVSQLTFDAQFDEWLARIICARFGVNPSPYVRMMNRATSEDLSEATNEEAVIPLMHYVKSVVDTVIAEDQNSPHLEFTWTSGQLHYREPNARINDLQLKSGAITLDDLRKQTGRAPLPNGMGAKPLVWTSSGPVLLEDILSGKYQAANGLFSAQNYELSLGDQNETAPGNYELTIGDDPSEYELSIKSELDSWERFAVNRLGKKTVRDFETKFVPAVLKSKIVDALKDCSSPVAIKAIFDDTRRNLGRRVRTPSVKEPLAQLEAEYRGQLKHSVEQAKSKMVKVA